MSNNQVKLTAPLRSIARRSLPECSTAPLGARVQQGAARSVSRPGRPSISGSMVGIGPAAICVLGSFGWLGGFVDRRSGTALGSPRLLAARGLSPRHVPDPHTTAGVPGKHAMARTSRGSKPGWIQSVLEGGQSRRLSRCCRADPPPQAAQAW